MTQLTIGLPVYNGERYLRTALEALLAQSHTDFQLIISDNASTDDTQAIARGFADQDTRILYQRLPANIGAARNFNRVFELARGTYFKWAAHDDICLPDYLKRCIEALDRDPSLVLAHCDVDVIDDQGQIVGNHDEDLKHVGSPRAEVRFRDLIFSEHWCTSVFGVMRRTALARTPLIAPFVGSDRTLLAELGLLGPFRLVPERLFQNRDHSDRSVHATDIRSADRLAWFDPTLSGRITLPFVRSWSEYARAIARSPLGPTEKLACYRTLGSWILPNRWRLRADVEHAVRQLSARAAKVVSGTR